MTRQTLAATGDSQTTPRNAFNVAPWLTWPPAITALLRREGYDIRSRSFGTSGERTDQFLARADELSFYDAPFIVAINGGINDKAASVSDPTITTNLQALIKVAKFGVRGSRNTIGNVPTAGVAVAGQANLPKTAEPGDRFVVLADTSTTGGTPPLTVPSPAAVTGTATGPTVWQCATAGQSGERGWYRIATSSTAPTHCTRVLVIGYGYQNWTTGGDTPSTPVASNAALRADQLAAVTAENVQVNGRSSVVFVDVYATMKARVTAGTDPDFSVASYDATKDWHAIQNNLHHNAYGHSLVAQASRAAMPAGWLTELAAANAA